ncbi:sulfate transporter [Leptospira perolatii]|uniref:Sulfate transporter n=1 Tax=Leptospira perolatii TaxID=2023191 RepID=A0A2M9ZR10_9LEPT|nr:SulP family inorganic anion transporter [Leptospira perolatii]PJZ70986.1 sulfate transporter [Leptospira perolatii]PJZ74518.1 sulfate transporter [Leptospira perolatii]
MSSSTQHQTKNIVRPKDWIQGLRENWKSDIISGFVIFLIALPLCIGIAIASGAPPMAGILSGIVGGMIVSLISGSYVTINGPAAGLIVIVLGSIEALGKGDMAAGFKYTLAATVIAGLFQIGLSFLRAGTLANLFPSAVIHGMLAAIGVIIFIKQFSVALGAAVVSKSIPGLISEMPSNILNLNPEVALIGILSIIIVFGLPALPWAVTKKIPAPLLVVTIAMIFAWFFGFAQEHQYEFFGKQYSVGPKSLVNIPSGFIEGLTAPDFGIIGTFDFWKQVFAITLVASLESQLTVTAIDKLDPYRRQSNLNLELFAKGVGNSILGMIGGLPIIAEVVRSSANINNGAKTRWSNFFHGFFLFSFILLIPGVVRMIPLAALAAILIVTGYRLSIPELKKTWKVGIDQVLIFFITIIFTVSVDLLVGIGVGVLAKIAFHFVNVLLPKNITINDFFTARYSLETKGDKTKVSVEGLAVFFNFLSLRTALYNLEKKKEVEIDISGLLFLDHTVMENLLSFCERYQEDGGKAKIVGMEASKPLWHHPAAGRKKVS